MRNIFILVLFVIFLSLNSVYAEEITLVNPSLSSQTETAEGQQAQMEAVSGEGIITGRGNSTVTLIDRYQTGCISVDMDTAREVFPSGEDVPKPVMSEKVVEARQDLQPGYACEAILNKPFYFQEFAPGEKFMLDVTFHNIGTETWDFNIDVMQYTGDRLEGENGKYVYDLGKDYKTDENYNANARRVLPGGYINFTLELQAPTVAYHDDDNYYSAYTLVKNYDQHTWGELHSDNWYQDHHTWDGQWEAAYSNGEDGFFCPVYFYIHVPGATHEE